MANIRDRRKRRANSVIFDGSEKRSHIKEQSETQNLDNQIDLTKMQDSSAMEQISEIDDEMDILDAYIDPLDRRGQELKYRLTEEIESEKQKIKCKFLFKYGRQESDPFRLWS